MGQCMYNEKEDCIQGSSFHMVTPKIVASQILTTEAGAMDEFKSRYGSIIMLAYICARLTMNEHDVFERACKCTCTLKFLFLLCRHGLDLRLVDMLPSGGLLQQRWINVKKINLHLISSNSQSRMHTLRILPSHCLVQW